VLKLRAILIFFLAVPFFGQQPAIPEQLLESVHKNVDLSAAGSYTLTATVVGNPDDPKKQQTGQLRIDRDHDRFRVELLLPGYQEVRVTLGNKRYIPKTQATLFVTDLANFDRTWDPLKEDLTPRTEKPTFGKVTHKKIRRHETICFDLTQPGELRAKTHYCIDQERAVVLRRDMGEDRTEFFDYASLAGHMIPRKVTIRKPSIANLELRDISISYQRVDPARFAIPDQSVEVETCQDEQQPKPVFTPEPRYSDEARSKHHETTILLHALVDNTGTVQDARALNPTGDGLDVSAVNTVRGWKFKPATCSGHPVSAEMMIEVDFRLR
jgi:TonB family protein